MKHFSFDFCDLKEGVRFENLSIPTFVDAKTQIICTFSQCAKQLQYNCRVNELIFDF